MQVIIEEPQFHFHQIRLNLYVSRQSQCFHSYISNRLSIMGYLRLDLKQALVKNIDSKFYLPEEALMGILTDENVEKCVGQADIEEHCRHGCITAVLNGGKKVLALLIMLNRVEIIRNFVETDQLPRVAHLDSRLPFEQESLERILENDVDAIIDISKNQWEVMAPYFQEEQSHRAFQVDVVVPFIKSTRKAGGGFGDIYEVTLPDTHHGFVRQQAGRVSRLIT